MQLRRLDPLANAGPYQRLSKSPVKSFSLTEAQYERVKAQRPDLLVTEGDGAVIGHPFRDLLEVHYAFPDVEAFRDRFEAMFNRVVGASSKTEAPRGLVIAFRDRPNRPVAETLFWGLALDEGQQWVEMNLVAVPEQPQPAEPVGDGHTLRDVTAADFEALAAIDAEVTGLPPLTAAGVGSILTDARLVRLVLSPSKGLVRRTGEAAAAAYVSLRTDPGGWGVIEALAIRPAVQQDLRRPLIDWCIAWLRNNGGRRVRMRVAIDDSAAIAALREAGFTPGETGLDYTRSVDPAEVTAKVDERKAHGTVIKFGDWR